MCLYSIHLLEQYLVSLQQLAAILPYISYCSIYHSNTYISTAHDHIQCRVTDKEPDKRATLSSEQLQMIKIKNEYDLQHLLYAVLKPIYLDIRSEVTEDSGVGMVRSDLKIPQLQVVVETKCTREKMQLKKLTEEIEADIVHYSEKNIIFFVYDKYKIIKERQSYEKYFNRTFDGKKCKNSNPSTS